MPMNKHGYDIIGDIHGCADTLELLLAKLGYMQINGVYSHAVDLHKILINFRHLFAFKIDPLYREAQK
jgi:hypothetical protein